MPNTGKTLKQFSLLTSLKNDDGVLIQRGNEYYYTKAQSIASGATLTETYADIATLKSGGNLERGATYYISDAYVWVFALGNDKFDYSGAFFARNADFQSNGVYAGITTANGFTVNATGTNRGVWTTSITTNSGDVAIWNNLHYLNITGSNGATNPSSDAVNWESVPNTDILVADTYGYIYEYDAIEYDFDNNSINRRVDLRGNDVENNTAIGSFQWGNSQVLANKVQGNGKFDIINQLGQVQNNIVSGHVVIESSNSSTAVNFCTFNFTYNASNKFNIYDYTGYQMTNVNVTGQSMVREIYMIANIDGESITDVHSTIEYQIDMVTTAYAGGTTYSFGDFATSGTVTYMYINEDDTAGNAPPNATYWVVVYDWTTALAFELTVSKYMNCAGTINLTSTNATETIHKVQLSTDFPTTMEMKFQCDDTGLVATFANTSYAIATNYMILSSGNKAVDGARFEFVVYEQYIKSGGTILMRELYTQIGIA